MPITPTYPGVYIEELPSGVRTIIGVATSVTAFVGRARRGPTDKATTIHSFGEYERRFGKLWEESPMSYAVYHYFLNGGADAVIVRVHNDGGAGTTATLTIRNEDDDGDIVLEAADPGSWGSQLRARVDYTTKDESDDTLFNLAVKDIATGVVETHRNLSTVESSPRYMTKVLLEDSDLVRVQTFGTDRPVETPDPDTGAKSPFEDSADGSASSNAVVASTVTDGLALTGTEISGSATEPKTGLHALDAADIVNLLVIPPYIADSNGSYLNGDISSTVRGDALNYAKGRRAVFLVDPTSSWTKKEDPLASSGGVDSAAFGLSRLQRDHQPLIERMIARTDAQRGVWKAPAGTEAALAGVPDLALRLTDAENGELNPQGINCLRIFKGIGRVACGARTMRGSDILADQWKYLPVRRTALYIEESLYRGTQWVVFEPNDERLWAQIRLNVGAFMHNMFRQGAFQGTSPRDAYLVKCDSETTTQNDINRGVVNILVGFAPLKPAEFVIIQIQQLAGQVES